MAVLTFKPKQVTKRLLVVLPERAQDVIMRRFALNKEDDRMTLEAIGQMYGITRERVRQVENFALGSMRKSDVFEKDAAVFEELKDLIASLGGVVREDDLLNHISNDRSTQNHITLLLVLGDYFKKQKECARFHHRWIVDEGIANNVMTSLKSLSKGLSANNLVTEDEITSSFLKHLNNVPTHYKNEEIIKRWLLLSKEIGRNPLGEWGMTSSPNVSARGMKDYAFLVIRQHGSPMHFTEVAKSILDVFGKKAHVATCHNELIKDERFVLVGRGLYALSDWGYQGGIVKDVIKALLKNEGPLTKEEIIDRVLKERYVKENTVFVNLQDRNHFKKNKDGKYAVK